MFEDNDDEILGGRSCGSAEVALPKRSGSLRKEGSPPTTFCPELKFCCELRAFKKAFGEILTKGFMLR